MSAGVNDEPRRTSARHGFVGVLVTTLLAAVGAPAVAVGQKTPEVKASRAEQARVTLDAYHALVAAYLNGDGSAAADILGWTPARLADVLGLIGVVGPGEAPLGARRFQAAAMLHTDGALLRVEARDGDAVPMHLEIASRLLSKGAPDTHEFARRWYVAVARLLRERGWLRHAEILLELGRKRLPRDPVVLCESGTLQEYMAGDRTLPPGPADRPAFFADGFMRQSFERDRRERLMHAAEWLRDSVDRGADSLCRLHGARVLSLLGENRSADPLLAELQDDADDALSYLASIFLGASAERRGDRSMAERCYRDALARFALGQSAQVALSAVLMQQGRTTEAREVLGRALDGEERSRREPWWWYHSEPKVVADARIEALRREVRR